MTAEAQTGTPQETYYAGAYWGPRKEPPEECARRTAVLLPLLASCEPFLAEWYKPARSPKEARKHPLMPPDVSVLTELFRSGVNREKGGPAFEELGFSVWFGNGGGDNDRASLRIKCGDYSGANPNACVLSLPTPGHGPGADRVITAPVLAGVVRSMARAWEPDWAVAMSHAHRDMDDESGLANMWVGWVTYLARHLGTVPPLPAPVRIELVEDQGTLIILTPERFTAANPEHVALARRVRELLSRAGLLRPMTP
ncbi:MAG TPA: immunity 52 family protein [Myxococcus sp.]|nr:immunity 52 family protein [Myxococcus sp.]